MAEAKAAPFARACEVCMKRHSVRPGGVAADGMLECRALPPVQDVARFARFPVVKPDGYCHIYFEIDAAAVAERNAEAVRQMKLDGLTTVTAERESQRSALAEAVAPLLTDAGLPAEVPEGDLAADLADPRPLSPAQVEALDHDDDGHAGGSLPKGKRARRARDPELPLGSAE